MRRPLTAAVCAVIAATGLALAAPAAAAPAAAPALGWQLRDTGTTNHFRGLAAVSASVAWVSGYGGQVLRTVDGGASWSDVSPVRSTSQLQFRDITASTALRAVAMAAGPDKGSRLYLTVDGGRSWSETYRNAEPAAFFDCMSFSDSRHGLVMSDPVDGKFRILATDDGGASWQVLPGDGMPAARDGEYGFAASGQCLTTSGRDAWFGTGGTSGARIFHSTDSGRTWTATDVPIRSSGSGGVIGLAFSTPSRGVVVGGDFARPEATGRTAATQLAGGAWHPSAPAPSGYRSGVTFVPRTAGTVLAVGLTGSDVSTDGGRSWTTFDTGQFDTVSCAADGACWASGDLGRVAVLHRG